MMGRSIYHSPYFLADIEREIFNNENILSRREVMERLVPYVKEETKKWNKIKSNNETYSWIISWSGRI